MGLQLNVLADDIIANTFDRVEQLAKMREALNADPDALEKVILRGMKAYITDSESRARKRMTHNASMRGERETKNYMMKRMTHNASMRGERETKNYMMPSRRKGSRAVVKSSRKVRESMLRDWRVAGMSLGMADKNTLLRVAGDLRRKGKGMIKMSMFYETIAEKLPDTGKTIQDVYTDSGLEMVWNTINI